MAHSGRTPAWKQDQMGGRTPAYGLGDGGRTPYGIGNVGSRIVDIIANYLLTRISENSGVRDLIFGLLGRSRL